MSQAILNQILEQLQILNASELEHLNQVIQKYLQDSRSSAQQTTFHQALEKSGLVRQVKRPTFQQQTQHSLIEAEGQAVSQTIIEERR